MLGRIYTFLFIATIMISLFYQRIYLNKSAIEFNAQLMAENVVLPTITGTHYNSLSFENGVLKSSFSGKNITYFNNKHFEATQNLVYQEMGSQTENNSQLTKDKEQIILKTEKAFGELVSTDPDNAPRLIGKNKLKYAILPDIVNFNLNDNVGQSSNVYIDALKRTLQSANSIVSQGPSGSIKGIGFFYGMDEGSFSLQSHVEGVIIPSQLPKN